MNTSDPHAPRPHGDPEHLLAARLRDTTPEFEARFDALRRRLAQEPGRQPWLDRLRAWPLALAGVGVAAALAAAVLLLPSTSPRLSPVEVAAYGELVALDDTLRDLLPLIDPETLEALLLMPTDPNGGHS